MQYPRVLIISAEVPETASAGGLLLYRLFKGYPEDRIFVVGKAVAPSASKLNCSYQVLSTRWKRLEQSRYNKMHRTLRAYGLLPQVSAANVKAQHVNFEPDVVLTVMEHGVYYDTAWSYSREYDLPLITIIHDTNEDFERVYPWAIKARRRRDANFYRHSVKRLCVSREMEQLNRMLYGAVGDVMYPNRMEELAPRPFDASAFLKTPGSLTIGFAGNTNYGYGEQLVRMLPAFQRANARLILFGPEPGGSAAVLLQAESVVEYRGFMPAQKVWQTIQSECDAVIQPYLNPAGHMENLYRHHFPSKLPEYLALGMPVLIYGPSFATGVKWGNDHPNAAITCSSTDVGEQAALLESLRDTSDWRVSLAEQAWLAGLADFNPVHIREQFWSHIFNASSLHKMQGV